MNKLIKSLIAFGIATGFASSATALTVSINPNSQSIGVGGQANYQIVASDLGSVVLAGFDAQINFDAAIAEALSATYGSLLGNNSGNQFTWIDNSVGYVYMLEVSDGPLISGAGDFVLGTFTLGGLAEGVTTLDFDTAFTSFTSEKGETIVSFTANSGSLTVTPDLGSSSSLLSLGLLGLGFARSRYNKA